MTEFLKKEFKEKRLYIPLILIAAFIAGSRLSKNSVLRYYAVFYILLIWYAAKTFKKPLPDGAVSIRKDARKFWTALIASLLLMTAVRFVKVFIVQNLMLHYQDDGVIDVITRSHSDMILFVLVMMFLMPVGESLFFRGMLVSFDNRNATIVTCIISLALTVILHVDGWIGIPVLLIPAIPLMVCYLLTKNLYLVMIANIFYCVFDNILFVVNDIARLLYSA